MYVEFGDIVVSRFTIAISARSKCFLTPSNDERKSSLRPLRRAALICGIWHIASPAKSRRSRCGGSSVGISSIVGDAACTGRLDALPHEVSAKIKSNPEAKRELKYILLSLIISLISATLLPLLVVLPSY